MDNNDPMKLSQLLSILSEGENEARQLSAHSNYEHFQTALMSLQSCFSQAIAIASSMEEAAGLRQMQTGSGSPGRSQSGSPRSDASERTSRKRKDSVKRKVKVPCTTPNSGLSDAALPPEDGYSWRKYGQKNILNSKNPRSYYRCTYQKSQNCPAIKQVQRSDEDPTFCDVTYQGDHTCGQTSLTQSLERQLLIAPQTDSTDQHQLMINFHHESYPDEQQGTTILSPPSISNANAFATSNASFGGQFSGASTDQSNYYYSAYQSQSEYGADFGGVSGNFHGSSEFGFGSDVIGFTDDQSDYPFNASHPFK